MGKTRKKRYHKKLGKAPGSIIYTGDKSKQLFVEIFDYNTEKCIDKELGSVEEAFNFQDANSVTWININGLNHVGEIEKLGTYFDLHPLVLEDIVSISQRPKIEDFEDYLFVVVKMLYLDNDENVIFEQVSFVLGEGYVLSFQEAEGDVFDAVRERIRQGKGRARSLQSDYLLYILLDSIVDHYFTVIETLGDKIEDFETAIFEGNVDDSINKEIQNLKREILKIRRAIVPLREVISRIEKDERSLILPKTKTFYRDIYDHLVQVTENIELYREMIWSLMDMYITTLSNKMNEVMKVLTIMASIFIPLTFIAGIYGMNFDYIPELHYRYSYPILLGVMVFIFIGMLLYFKRKKWL
ncbi:magnesium/cobalt transporter CorA [Flavobacteriaceae bacterium XHP0103]|uniref:magnesium/cobalt transporter CorA n=1 Tax=Marixanthotalea marina TaxID=2844359 RepID=UPI002989FB64|nr:magnesium/cobalt transporter CorA [Marixanthotalea marina]MBU3821568.1 magnesium/cobalt transporter CorA [Marixanthotalea marina]